MRRRPNEGSAISVEAAALLSAFLIVASDQGKRTQAMILALRSPGPTKELLHDIARSIGLDPNGPTLVDLSVPASRDEVKEFLRPVLESAATLASFGQLLDTYIWDTTADEVVFALYALFRFTIARDSTPTPQQKKTIWELTLKFAQASKIGSERWEELAAEGDRALDDWKSYLKNAARKRYETFLRRKTAIETSAQETFTNLMSMFA